MQGRNKKKKREKKRTEQAEKELLFEFMRAVFDDHVKAEAMLVNHPELMDGRRMGETVLHFLAVEGHIDAVKFLAGRGFDVNTVSSTGTTPLIDVALLGNDEMAALLLSLGANPNATCDTWDCVPFAGVNSGNAKLVRRLIDAGADVSYVADVFTWRDYLNGRPEKRAEMISVMNEFGQTL